MTDQLRWPRGTPGGGHAPGPGPGRFRDTGAGWADALAGRLPTPRINLERVVGRGDDEGGSGEAWAWQVEEAASWARSALEYDDPSGVRSRVVDVKVGMTEYDPDDPGSGEDAGLQIRGSFQSAGRSVGSWTIKVGYDIDTEEWTAVVDGIHLDEETRGQGIAGRWVRRLEQVLRDTTDVGEVSLWDQSGGFWEAMGYQNDGGHWHTFKRLRE